MLDENDDAAASVCDINRKNTRSGVGAMGSQSRESRDPERGRQIKIRFLDIYKVNEMRRNKV